MQAAFLQKAAAFESTLFGDVVDLGSSMSVMVDPQAIGMDDASRGRREPAVARVP